MMQIKQIQNLFPDAVEIIDRCTIARFGWEMDNEGVLCRMKDGSIKAFTTTHGRVYEWSLEGMREDLEAVENSQLSIRWMIHKLKVIRGQ